MNRILILFALLCALSGLTAGITVLEQSRDQLLLEFRLDQYELVRQGDFIRVSAPGLNYGSETGAPQLPWAEAKIAVPPGGSLRITVLSSSQRTEQLELPLLPVPRMEQNEISEAFYEPDPGLYQRPAPPLASALERTGFRGLEFVPLLLQPFAYDGQRSLRITEQALLKVVIEGDTQIRNAWPRDDLADLMLDGLLNPDQARAWKSDQRYDVHYADFARSDYWLRLETDRDGMYKITPEQLEGFPVADIDPRSFRLFSNGGVLLPFVVNNPGNQFRELPIHVAGEEDGSFDASDYIVFYGTNRDGNIKNQSLQSNATYYNPYSSNTVYWLTFGGEFTAPPLRMQTGATQTSWTNVVSSYRDQVRLEKESQRREIYGFDWYMTRLFGSSTAEYQFELELSDVEPGTQQDLSFKIRQEEGGNNIWHNISVYVNNVPVPADTTGSLIFSWFGSGAYTFSKQVSSFVSGTNLIRLKVQRNQTDNLFLDWITVDYTRQLNVASGPLWASPPAFNYNVSLRYDLTGSATARVYKISALDQVAIVPLQSDTSGSYFVASALVDGRFAISADAQLYTPTNISGLQPRDLTDSATQADNVIITPDEFFDQAQSLADIYWQDLSRRSLVVRQSEIFDQFNGGHPDPVALRQFLRYAYQDYAEPKLSSVTLLGLGSIDWRNNSNQAAAKNRIMVFQKGELTSDDYYVMLTQSFYPELAIGRYPVSSTAELNNMISNFRNYHRDPQGGWWRNSMVFLGDDLYNGSQNVYENNHTQETQEAADIVHPSILVDKIFAWEYPYDEYQNKPSARDDMLAAVNAGTLVWLYTGHGAYDNLGAEDYFNGASDLGRFQNQDKLPVFMAASCSVSHFDYWGYESLAQKLVLMNNLGAIASYSATRLSNSSQNSAMIKLLLDNLANKRNPLGYSIARAKFQFTQGVENDAVYVLLGDPLLKSIPPVRDSVMSVGPEGDGAGGDTLYARQLVAFGGSFDPSAYSGTAEVRIFNPETGYNLDWETHVTHRGATLFNGSVSVASGQYSGQFIVPDDVVSGETGLAVAYLWDPGLKQDYVNFRHPLALDDQAVGAANPDAPEIKIYLGNLDFRPGDTVGTSPLLLARISDSNGINITGSSGHNILLILDNALQPIAVTSHFQYDLDSYTQGLLTYQLAGLAEGPHTLQVVAFDNFNQPSVASTNFTVKKTGVLSLERFLIYPNPMQDSASFTFMLSRDSDLDIDIFSLTGKKIHSFKAMGKSGFNAVKWNGRDARGDRLANNTYFVRIRARAEGSQVEKTERLVIYN